ncbi:MAG: SDR family oxidoreductase [Gammaproteobacteria bacterium]|nr:SDR family oxidoreductase [Gammaproteobacteria bacterium]
MDKSNSSRLVGKVAIVTGAGQGIGEAIARRFAREGALVVVNARTTANINRVVDAIGDEGGTAHAVTADIGTSAGVGDLIAGAASRFEHIDILAHNAGIFPYNPIEDMHDDDWTQVMDVNLTSAYRLTKACIPAMKQRCGGRIIFSSSVQGNHVAVPGCAHYAASKSGLNGFIRAAALELAEYKITVNGVEPGLVLTPGTENALSERRRDLMAQYVPLKRWGEPAEVAHAMLYLASAEAAYVTGQTIIVDGGALLPQSGAFMV